ncbi:helix-turn-helix domain-containing protein [Burkholderia gladioli]|jgi:CheY-like chemotaxis protein|uniref:Helix-turn-helix domain-containing protein n=1 Tax=Burkholderia gladioli TaxID=28095 RepID=A0AAP1UX18_BURGA|nr:helix-turn-helix domain-containing protein [Burkholderia gladioli]AJX00211.1 response regulator [Burkholderia gladioli]ASD78811.1 hypothetical protein CEJ98_07205 [Burkholderia gladioli pv. gladioli]AWY55942.1 hypothetical protein A8H28_33940 [Burkholderia gladioli pv. gladioli]KGC10429.1 response regulator [Burkholderia gladioli]MBA1366685.1 response regulator [Burkholderia gladioli]
MLENQDGPDDAGSIAQRVRQLLESQGVAKRQYATEIQRILGLSYSQALRKIKGENPWTILQLRAVAAEYGESAAQLVADDASQGSEAESPDGVARASLTIGGRDYECQAEIGGRLSANRSPEFVAIMSGDRWHVFPRDAAPAGEKFEVYRISIQVREISDPAVAVVDDDPAITEQICSYLNRTGFIAKGYTSYRSFLAELKSASFDAVIIDWLLDGITARYPIEEIISSAPAPLVYLLTGKIATGEASEVEMAEIIQKYDISALEKPLRLPWLVADLNRRLNQRRD